jgi:hypothetical protein
LTASILRYFNPPIKPLPDAAQHIAYVRAVGQALRAGEQIREFNRRKDDFSARKGRAA